MGKVRILSEIEKKDIISKYSNENIGVELLSKLYGVGKLKIKGVLEENNIPIKKRGAQIKNHELLSADIGATTTKTYEPISNEYTLVAICKKTNKEFNDVNNLSGVLTTHILETFGSVSIPNNSYQRKKYELEHGKKWFEEYFDIIQKEIETIETKKCPYCEWETVDIENKSGVFQNHLLKEHGLNVNEYLKEYPSDINYFKTYIERINRNNFLNDTNNHITCLECGEKFKTLNEKHMRTKHNMSLLDYKLKHSITTINSKNTLGKLKTNYIIGLGEYESTYKTKPHDEISKYIRSLGFKVKDNDKKLLNGVELDIVIPEKKLAIEYNGLYYHREGMGKDRNYHLNKTLLCNKNGYNLLQIFEDEWIENKDMVLKKIKHLLGLNNGLTIYARKTILREISNTEGYKFLNENHIQGGVNSGIFVGCFYMEELVGVMVFNNKRNMNGGGDINTYDLTRFATKNDYRVIGVGGKIISYFVNNYNPKKIISFGDRRWVLDAENNFYTKLGFKLTKILKPDYRYYNTKYSKFKRLHKFGFGKKSIAKKYPEVFSPDKTEKEMMLELGFDRIWDCGLFKYELDLKK